MILDEIDPRLRIPFKAGHYQFTFRTSRDQDAKAIRRIYTGKDMNTLHDEAKRQALLDYPKSYGHAMYSPQNETELED